MTIQSDILRQLGVLDNLRPNGHMARDQYLSWSISALELLLRAELARQTAQSDKAATPQNPGGY